jgi:hypothetical protein
MLCQDSQAHFFGKRLSMGGLWAGINCWFGALSRVQLSGRIEKPDADERQQ